MSVSSNVPESLSYVGSSLNNALLQWYPDDRVRLLYESDACPVEEDYYRTDIIAIVMQRYEWVECVDLYEDVDGGTFLKTSGVDWKRLLKLTMDIFLGFWNPDWRWTDTNNGWVRFAKYVQTAYPDLSVRSIHGIEVSDDYTKMKLVDPACGKNNPMVLRARMDVLPMLKFIPTPTIVELCMGFMYDGIEYVMLVDEDNVGVLDGDALLSDVAPYSFDMDDLAGSYIRNRSKECMGIEI